MLLLFYILKSAVCLIITWLFYQLVLRRLTFYTWNRWFLLVCSALSFLLPLVDISSLLEKNNWTASPFVSAIPPIPDYQPQIVAQNIPDTTQPFYISLLPWLLTLGAFILLVRLIVQYFSLLSMRRSARLLLQGPVKVFQVDKPVIPFSFGNAIYLNQHLHEENELKEIIRHEFIHVKQRHTIDIIWSELVCILTWYNPFAWLLRKAIRQNLEFIADQQVLKTGFDRRQYQYLLLKVIGVPSYSIASNFNFKSLKKRIAMMNKVKTAKVHLVRFLLLLPVVAVILIAFRNASNNRQQPVSEELLILSDTVPTRPGTLPENVSSIRSYNDQVTVTLKNGKEERYNLNNADERKAFEKKYGRMPVPPVPPTPVEAMIAPPAEPGAAPAPVIEEPIAPAPVASAVAPVPAEPPSFNQKGYWLGIIETPKGRLVVIKGENGVADVIPLETWEKDNKKYEEKYGKLPPSRPAQMAAPRPPMPPPARVNKWPKEVSGFHMRDNKVTITLKNGKTEEYDLDKPEERAKYQSKYGYEEEMPIEEPGTVAVAMAHPATTAHATTVTARAHESPAKISEAHAPIIEAHAAGGVSHVQEPEHESEILGVIKRSATRQDLEKLKTELAAKGIRAEWKIISEKDGIIEKLEGRLHDKNSDCHFKVDSFSSVVIIYRGTKNGKNSLLVKIDERIKPDSSN